MTLRLFTRLKDAAALRNIQIQQRFEALTTSTTQKLQYRTRASSQRLAPTLPAAAAITTTTTTTTGNNSSAAITLARAQGGEYLYRPQPRGSQTQTQTQTQIRTQTFATTSAARMATDDEYMAFLEKANRDPNEEGPPKPKKSSSSVKVEFKATDEGAEIPECISKVTTDAFYVSDADEPFVPVCLNWIEARNGLPDESEFAQLIHHPSPEDPKIDITIMDPAEWDTQGQYKELIDAVTQAGKGNDVQVYRVPKDDVRVEYWVITTVEEEDPEDNKIVGVKAAAVES
ncbi:hypothetical protein F4777DRAFT_531836 [Nemania sp. FL0916]|nr:hypothetical protein F4777DRAFT_531836 [Nemania sp. FL0916]